MAANSIGVPRTKFCASGCTWAISTGMVRPTTGTHEPLVTRESWQRVQELLDARAESKTRKVKHDFAFTGLVQCGHCGCFLVGELKKGQYVYYHCTGNRGKCPEPYTRQEVLTRRVRQHPCRSLSFRNPSLNG